MSARSAQQLEKLFDVKPVIYSGGLRYKSIQCCIFGKKSIPQKLQRKPSGICEKNREAQRVRYRRKKLSTFRTYSRRIGSSRRSSDLNTL